MSGAAATIPSTPAAAPAPAADPAANPGNPTPNPGNPDANPGNAPDFRTTIPEAYREKTYLRDVKSAEDVFKMLDHAQTAIGKKGLAIPAEGAPQEEFDRFYNSLGRPETPDKYEFKRAEGVQVDEAVDNQVKAIMHKHGIPAKAATALVSEYEAIIDQRQLAFDQEFDQLVDGHFGSKDAADKALSESQVMLGKVLPPSVIPYLGQLDAKGAMLMAVLTSEIQKKYGGEDPTRLVGQPPANALNTKEAIIAEGNRLMAQPAYKDAFHPDHAKTVEAVNATFAKINALK